MITVVRDEFIRYMTFIESDNMVIAR